MHFTILALSLPTNKLLNSEFSQLTSPGELYSPTGADVPKQYQKIRKCMKCNLLVTITGEKEKGFNEGHK